MCEVLSLIMSEYDEIKIVSGDVFTSAVHECIYSRFIWCFSSRIIKIVMHEMQNEILSVSDEILIDLGVLFTLFVNVYRAIL